MRAFRVVFEDQVLEVQFKIRLLEEMDLTQGRIIGGRHLQKLRDKLLRDDHIWSTIVLTEKTDLVVTECTIYRGYGMGAAPTEQLFYGKSICMFQDKFDAQKGRKLALSRALEAERSKGYRQTIWAGFLNYFGIPRRKTG